MTPRRPTRASAALLALVALGAGLAACGVGPRHTIDASSVERQIATQLAAAYPVTAPAVTCTSGVPAQAGRTFSCSTVIDGQPLELAGTVTDHSGHFTWTPTSAVIDTRRAAARLEEQISASTHSPTTVSCGAQRVLVVAVHHPFSCTARIDKEPPRQVTVTVDNLQGDTRFSLAPLPPGENGAATTRP